MCKIFYVLTFILFLILSGNVYAKEEKLSNKITFSLSYELWISNPDGSERKQLTHEGGISEPSWAPDGKSIVYVCDKKIWKYDFSSGKSQKLVDLPGYCINPSFSSNGQKIVFTHESNSWDPFVGSNYTEICIVNSDGSSPQVALPGKESWKSYPQFSPWGDKLVFNELKGNNVSYYLAMYNFSTGLTDYLSSEVGWLEPTFSPDGNLVATGWYSYEEGGGLRLINLKSLTQNDLISEYPATQFCSPSFSSDGSRIVFEKQLYDKSKKMFIPYGVYTINTSGTGLSLIIMDASDPDWLK